MRHYRSLEEVSISDSWLTIGVFDGVHRGHQQIIRKLTAGAHSQGVPAVVLTFHPHPASVLGTEPVRCLTTPDERAALLATLGVDVIVTHPFDKPVAGLSAREFMERLKKSLGLSHLLIGYDFALGRGREGNAARLTEIGRELAYAVEVIPAVSDASGVISSTEIRKLISLGDVAEAAKLLGHPYSLHGEVVRGDQRGRTIGFPTANLALPADKSVPSNGIYVCRAALDGENFMAAVNIGVNPTFTPDKRVVNVEAYLLDFGRDIYGRDLALEFVDRLRDELKFDSVPALIQQMNEDVQRARAILSVH
jgi:riboflavin kinase / FMN adenylyltransferase